MTDNSVDVRIDDIDLNFTLYSCSWPLLFDPLINSIRRVGLLKPITLVQKQEKYVVASGLRRAHAAKILGLGRLKCRILEPAPKDSALFFMNLEENLAGRPLNFFEKARAVKRIVEDLDHVDKKSIDTYLSILDVKNNEAVIQQTSMLDRLDSRVKTFLHDRGLTERFAQSFINLPTEDSLELVKVADQMKLTAGQIREVIELGKEISKRDNAPFCNLLRTMMPAPEDDADEKHRPRDMFISQLRDKRFPEFSKMRSKMDKSLSRINGSAGIRISAPQNFEGDRFTAALSFRNGEELESLIKTLLDYAVSDDLAKSVELLDI